MTLGAQLTPGQTTWSALSDRNVKAEFLAVNGQPDREVRHIGPMAQDWQAAFGFSRDSTTINSGDFDGVNLAAVQALERRTRELQAENAELRARLERLESLHAPSIQP
jgi:hypothetical protein